MQENYQKALEFSKYRQTLSVQRKILREKVDAKLTYGINGGIFKINTELLNFVDLLIREGREVNALVLDVNGNPILIEDVNEFKEEIFDRYFQATFEYHEAYQEIKKSRSVESLTS